VIEAMDPRAHPLASDVPRVPRCSPDDFRRRWVSRAEPVVIEGVAADWPAAAR
jgi:hypothetical protein